MDTKKCELELFLDAKTRTSSDYTEHEYRRKGYDHPHLTKEQAEHINRYVDIRLLFIPHDNDAEHFEKIWEKIAELNPSHSRLLLECSAGGMPPGMVDTASPRNREYLIGRLSTYLAQIQAREIMPRTAFAFARLAAKSQGIPVVSAGLGAIDNDWWLDYQELAGNESLPNWNEAHDKLREQIYKLPFTEALSQHARTYEKVNEWTLNMPEFQRQRDRTVANLVKHWAWQDANQAQAQGVKKELLVIYGDFHASPIKKGLREYGLHYSDEVVPFEVRAPWEQAEIDLLTAREFLLDFFYTKMRAKIASGEHISYSQEDSAAQELVEVICGHFDLKTIRDLYECHRAGYLTSTGHQALAYLTTLFNIFAPTLNDELKSGIQFKHPLLQPLHKVLS